MGNAPRVVPKPFAMQGPTPGGLPLGQVNETNAYDTALSALVNNPEYNKMNATAKRTSLFALMQDQTIRPNAEQAKRTANLIHRIGELGEQRRSEMTPFGIGAATSGTGETARATGLVKVNEEDLIPPTDPVGFAGFMAGNLAADLPLFAAGGAVGGATAKVASKVAAPVVKRLAPAVVRATEGTAGKVSSGVLKGIGTKMAHSAGAFGAVEAAHGGAGAQLKLDYLNELNSTLGLPDFRSFHNQADFQALSQQDKERIASFHATQIMERLGVDPNDSILTPHGEMSVGEIRNLLLSDSPALEGAIEGAKQGAMMGAAFGTIVSPFERAAMIAKEGRRQARNAQAAAAQVASRQAGQDALKFGEQKAFSPQEMEIADELMTPRQPVNIATVPQGRAPNVNLLPGVPRYASSTAQNAEAEAERQAAAMILRRDAANATKNAATDLGVAAVEGGAFVDLDQARAAATGEQLTPEQIAAGALLPLAMRGAGAAARAPRVVRNLKAPILSQRPSIAPEDVQQQVGRQRTMDEAARRLEALPVEEAERRAAEPVEAIRQPEPPTPAATEPEAQHQQRITKMKEEMQKAFDDGDAVRMAEFANRINEMENPENFSGPPIKDLADRYVRSKSNDDILKASERTNTQIASLLEERAKITSALPNLEGPQLDMAKARIARIDGLVSAGKRFVDAIKPRTEAIDVEVEAQRVERGKPPLAKLTPIEEIPPESRRSLGLEVDPNESLTESLPTANYDLPAENKTKKQLDKEAADYIGNLTEPGKRKGAPRPPDMTDDAIKAYQDSQAEPSSPGPVATKEPTPGGSFFGDARNKAKEAIAAKKAMPSIKKLAAESDKKKSIAIAKLTKAYEMAYADNDIPFEKGLELAKKVGERFRHFISEDEEKAIKYKASEVVDEQLSEATKEKANARIASREAKKGGSIGKQAQEGKSQEASAPTPAKKPVPAQKPPKSTAAKDDILAGRAALKKVKASLREDEFKEGMRIAQSEGLEGVKKFLKEKGFNDKGVELATGPTSPKKNYSADNLEVALTNLFREKYGTGISTESRINNEIQQYAALGLKEAVELRKQRIMEGFVGGWDGVSTSSKSAKFNKQGKTLSEDDFNNMNMSKWIQKIDADTIDNINKQGEAHKGNLKSIYDKLMSKGEKENKGDDNYTDDDIDDVDLPGSTKAIEKGRSAITGEKPKKKGKLSKPVNDLIFGDEGSIYPELATLLAIPGASGLAIGLAGTIRLGAAAKRAAKSAIERARTIIKDLVKSIKAAFPAGGGRRGSIGWDEVDESKMRDNFWAGEIGLTRKDVIHYIDEIANGLNGLPKSAYILRNKLRKMTDQEFINNRHAIMRDEFDKVNYYEFSTRAELDRHLKSGQEALDEVERRRIADGMVDSGIIDSSDLYEDRNIRSFIKTTNRNLEISDSYDYLAYIASIKNYRYINGRRVEHKKMIEVPSIYEYRGNFDVEIADSSARPHDVEIDEPTILNLIKDEGGFNSVEMATIKAMLPIAAILAAVGDGAMGAKGTALAAGAILARPLIQRIGLKAVTRIAENVFPGERSPANISKVVEALEMADKYNRKSPLTSLFNSLADINEEYGPHPSKHIANLFNRVLGKSYWESVTNDGGKSNTVSGLYWYDDKGNRIEPEIGEVRSDVVPGSVLRKYSERKFSDKSGGELWRDIVDNVFTNIINGKPVNQFSDIEKDVLNLFFLKRVKQISGVTWKGMEFVSGKVKGGNSIAPNFGDIVSSLDEMLSGAVDIYHGDIEKGKAKLAFAPRFMYADNFGRKVNGGMSVTQLHEAIRNDMNAMQERGIRVLNRFRAIKEDQRELLAKYMRGEITDKELASMDPSVRDNAEEMRGFITYLGHQLVDMGVLDQRSFERFSDHYLREIYVKKDSTNQRINHINGFISSQFKRRGIERFIDADNVSKYTTEWKVDREENGRIILKSPDGEELSVTPRMAKIYTQKWWAEDRTKQGKLKLKVSDQEAERYMQPWKKYGYDDVEQILSPNHPARSRKQDTILYNQDIDPSLDEAFIAVKEGDVYKYTTDWVRDGNMLRSGDKVTIRRELTKEEHEAAGRVPDVEMAIKKTISDSIKNIMTAKFFSEVADSYSFAENPDPSRPGYVQIPKETIPGTSLKRYGKLAGRWVDAGTALDLAHLRMIREAPSIPFDAAARLILGNFKKNKTVRSWVTMLNNYIGNPYMIAAAGGSWTGYFSRFGKIKEAAQYENMVNNGEDIDMSKPENIRRHIAYQELEEARRYGAIDGNHSLEDMSNEIMATPEMVDPFADDMSNIERSLISGRESMEANILKYLTEVMGKGATETVKKEWTDPVSGKVFRIGDEVSQEDAMINMYHNADTVTRLELFHLGRSQGMSGEEAARFARENGVDYAYNAPLINLMRKSVAPFAVWSIRMGEVNGRMLRDRPLVALRMASSMAILNLAASTISNWMAGGDEKKEREALPDRMRNDSFAGFELPDILKDRTMAGLAPSSIRLWSGLYADTTKFIPGFGLADINERTGAPKILGNSLTPAAAVFDTAMGRDPYTGKELPKDERLKALGKQWLPNDPYYLDSALVRRLSDWVAGTESRTGDRMGFSEVLGLGSYVPPAATERTILARHQRESRKLEADRRAALENEEMGSKGYTKVATEWQNRMAELQRRHAKELGGSSK